MLETVPPSALLTQRSSRFISANEFCLSGWSSVCASRQIRTSEDWVITSRISQSPPPLLIHLMIARSRPDRDVRLPLVPTVRTPPSTATPRGRPTREKRSSIATPSESIRPQSTGHFQLFASLRRFSAHPSCHNGSTNPIGFSSSDLGFLTAQLYYSLIPQICRASK